MLKKKFFLIVSRARDRFPIEFDTYPSEEEILAAIKEQEGTNARVEERYVLSE